jgi:hypothetical protein
MNIEQRIDELTAKIPVGTICTEDNHFGGFLTPEEAQELEDLFWLQRKAIEATQGFN